MAVERASGQCQEVSVAHRIFHNDHMGSGKIKSTSTILNNKGNGYISSKNLQVQYSITKEMGISHLRLPNQFVPKKHWCWKLQIQEFQSAMWLGFKQQCLKPELLNPRSFKV